MHKDREGASSGSEQTNKSGAATPFPGLERPRQIPAPARRDTSLLHSLSGSAKERTGDSGN